MGDVFLAHRADGSVSQQVAIKIIRADMLDAHTLARFRLERQVLAILEHPNIASLIDAGELDDGSPFVVMEFVEGRPITAFAQERRLGVRERLQLFLQACEAVAYAHRNMIVHRDLKPSNILVGAHGRPILLDFGIAKPLVRELGVVDVQDTATAQRFFSLHNVAPEHLRGEPVAVSCDIYALGVLLYELLSGHPPFDFTRLTPAQIERCVLENEPPAPSLRAANARPATAASDALKGDLDSIVLKCLRKSPNARYASVDLLVADIRSFLECRPVEARRGRKSYRLRKFISRHRAGVTVAVLFASLLGGASISLLRQHAATVLERNRAEQVTAFLVDTFSAADPEASGGGDITAKQLMQRAASRLDQELDDQPETKARLIGVIAQVNLALGEPKQALQAIGNVDALAFVQKGMSHETRMKLLGSAVRARVAMADYDETKPLLARLSALSETLADRVDTEMLRASLQQGLGEFKESSVALRALESVVTLQNGFDIRTVSRYRYLLANALAALDERTPAMAIYRDLLALQRGSLPPNHPLILSTLREIAQIAVEMGDVSAALDAAREAVAIGTKLYGATSIEHAGDLSMEGNVYLAADKFDLAVADHRDSLRIDEAVYGRPHPTIAKEYLNLASALEAAGKDQHEALRNYLKSIEVGEAVWPASHQNLLTFRVAAACLAVQIDEFAIAARVTDAAVAAARDNESLRGFGLYPLALFVRSVAAYGLSHRAADQTAIAERLDEMRRGALDEDTKQCMESVVTKARALGVKLPEPATAAQ
jgi:serine/threonine-protein kinase